MDRRHRLIAVLAVAGIVAGCSPAQERDARSAATSTSTSNERTAAEPTRAGEPRPSDTVPIAASPTPSAAATGQWFLQESDPPRAVWGVPASEGMLTFSCDRAGARLLLERHAVGVPESVRMVAIDADGTRVDYPAERRETELAPVLVTPIALDAPIVDSMLTARRMVVTAGTDAIATIEPGPSLRAVVEACRRGTAE